MLITLPIKVVPIKVVPKKRGPIKITLLNTVLTKIAPTVATVIIRTLLNAVRMVFLGFAFTGYAIASQDLSTAIELESTWFPRDGAYANQNRENFSLALTSKYGKSWRNDRQSFTLEAFMRLDSKDKERNHFELREFNYISSIKQWEIEIGISRVFWGVTESEHLVDIINQTDLVESFDGESKLGQPLLRMAYFSDFGDSHFIIMPYFRARSFVGEHARLHGQLLVDADHPLYEDADKENHWDFAARWESSFSLLDIGIAHFYGTSRDPVLVASIAADQNTYLQPFYKLIHQTGVDLQLTLDNLMIKHESIYRRYQSDQEKDFYAQVSGFEYTYYALFDSAIDVGLISEYLFSSQENNSLTAFDDNIFLGARLNFNTVDSASCLVGAIIDLRSSAILFRLETTKRFYDAWSGSLEFNQFISVPDDNLFSQIKRDSYLRLLVEYYF